MIDIVLYRQRIGGFSQKIKNKKFLKYNYFATYDCKKYHTGGNFYSSKLVWIRALLIISIFTRLIDQNERNIKNINICETRSIQLKNVAVILPTYREEICKWRNWSKFNGNFFARYLNGNGRTRGVRVYHLNIRKLQNKVSEIKNVIKELNPHLFFLSLSVT